MVDSRTQAGKTHVEQTVPVPVTVGQRFVVGVVVGVVVGGGGGGDKEEGGEGPDEGGGRGVGEWPDEGGGKGLGVAMVRMVWVERVEGVLGVKLLLPGGDGGSPML